MALVPVDTANQICLYSNNNNSNNSNNRIGTISNLIVPSFAPKSEYPLDPKNDLMPPAYSSPLIDMKFGPPEQTVKRYFSLTIDDIDSFHKEKIKKWIKVYEKVLGYCFRKVREHVLRDQKFCFFPVPEYLAGFPLYNITHCTCFIIKKLNQSGFQTKYIPPNMIYIHWNIDNQYERVVRPQSVNPEIQSHKIKPRKKDKVNENIHYIKLEPEKNNNVPDFQPETVTNNSKYGFQQEDRFLFG